MSQPTQPAPAGPTVPAAPAADGRSARRVDTRETISAAAFELFAARGVSATSIEDIAERAGTAKGSVFYNFGSKAGLVESLMADSIGRLSTALDEATAGLTGPALHRQVVRTLLAQMQANPDAARLMATEVFRTDRSWRETTTAWREVTISPIARDLAVTAGDADQAGRAEHTVHAAAIVGATLVAGLEWLVFDPGLSYDEVCQSILTALHLT